MISFSNEMVQKRKDSPLRTKSEAYSIRITNLYRYLLNTKKEKVVATQIYRSGTSIGANIAEGQFAQSEADLINKFSIALKEAGETEYWLNNLYQTGLIDEKGFTSMHNDNTELIKMLVASIKTLISKNGNP